MGYSNGDGGMNGNAAGKPVVESQPVNTTARPTMPTSWT